MARLNHLEVVCRGSNFADHSDHKLVNFTMLVEFFWGTFTASFIIQYVLRVSTIIKYTLKIRLFYSVGSIYSNNTRKTIYLQPFSKKRINQITTRDYITLCFKFFYKILIYSTFKVNT